PEAILKEHPKGIEYGHLLSGKFPVFLDGAGEVVSLPPIINAQRTAVTTATRDVLVDVTGTDLKAVRQTIALLATCLAERGGTIEAVTVHDASGIWTSPDLRPAEHVLHTDDVAALLGLEWSGEHVAECLRRMGHDADAFDNKVQVQVGAWRQDILHPVDLMEDVGIGHGFDRFPGELPVRATFGGRLAHQDLEDSLRALLTGHGWLEARTLTLSDAKAQWTNWGEKPQAAVKLLNPVVEEQTILRTRLLPSLLHVLAQNRHRSLPQRLFEVGYVVVNEGGAWHNRIHVAGVEVAAKAGFSDVKGLVEAMLRDARIGATLAAGDKSGFIRGRTGAIQANGRTVGHFGELHPDTVVAFGLTAPATAFEMDLTGLWR
ncbi:MAG: phenylalanine--tRNA ligase subunit beta, partial [Halobacteriales archaeon]|nr:phenylalanine--tRNA ligase subunit beta [Halobacteriales archaeon]